MPALQLYRFLITNGADAVQIAAPTDLCEAVVTLRSAGAVRLLTSPASSGGAASVGIPLAQDIAITVRLGRCDRLYAISSSAAPGGQTLDVIVQPCAIDPGVVWLLRELLGEKRSGR